MADIVFVHGIAQEQVSSDALEDRWIQDVAGATRTAGFPELADAIRLGRMHGGIHSRMAYYADLFAVANQMSAEPEPLTQAELQVATLLAHEWLLRATTRSTDVAQKKAAAQQLALVQGRVAEQQGLPQYGRPVMNALARVRWFAPFGMMVAQTFVNRALKQVSQYMTDPVTRETAIWRVLQWVGEGTKVVIAHSLGSVIAYEALHRTSTHVPLFLTIGSPLGLETIIYQRLQPQPPKFPKTVKRWVNIADPDDLVAAEPDLRTKFSSEMPKEATLEGILVDCDALPHEASRYLCKEAVGCLVAEALKS